MEFVEDHLHSARKFTQFWGSPSDFKHAGVHVYQSVLLALKVHAKSISLTPVNSDDLNAILDTILEKDINFLRDRGLRESRLRSISDWKNLSAYDCNPAPSKDNLLTAITIAETLSVAQRS